MKIAAAQINTTIGDFEGNSEKILDRMRWAEGEGADLLVFPELCVCGYMPGDLLEKPSFIQRNLETVEAIAKETKDVAVVLGYASRNESACGRPLYNTAGILQNGKIRFVQNKTLLPDYDVFDECRYFEPAVKHRVYEVAGKRVGLTACEDLWSMFKIGGKKIYHHDPMHSLVKEGAQVIVNLSASPFTIEKQDIRRKLITEAAVKHKVPIVYCNLVGGNDELVFDGRSFAIDANGKIIYEAKAFEEDSFVVDFDEMKPLNNISSLSVQEEIYGALILGLRDYMRKCGFKKVVIGLSGGIDSAVTAAIACEALGSQNVMCVMMPSHYSSKGSVDDSQKLVANLGMHVCKEPIGKIYDEFRKELCYPLDSKDVSLAEENIQARIRGTILMAISNQENAIVLSTGNKSELSVGYCTLYGDMVGGFALISDVPKTLVYELARYINRNHEIIPHEIIDKPPSAELKPEQRDDDALPPYDELDPIIAAYVEDHRSIAEIVKRGFDRELVERVITMIDQNEYKRRQAAPGIKVTSKAFGSGRKFPIAAKYGRA